MPRNAAAAKNVVPFRLVDGNRKPDWAAHLTLEDLELAQKLKELRVERPSSAEQVEKILHSWHAEYVLNVIYGPPLAARKDGAR